MRKGLTLYVIPCGDKKLSNPGRTIASFGDIIDRYEVLENHNVYQISRHPTSWFCYMFDNEWLDGSLSRAIGSFIWHNYDYFVFFKLVLDRNRYRGFKTARLFRSEVELNQHLGPAKPAFLRFEKVLDGWILETPRI